MLTVQREGPRWRHTPPLWRRLEALLFAAVFVYTTWALSSGLVHYARATAGGQGFIADLLATPSAGNHLSPVGDDSDGFDVFDDDPLTAVKDVLASEQIDEVVVCTHPETTSGWLRKRLLDEIRKASGDRPVEHVVSDVSGRAGANVLVVANETVLDEPLLDG